ncbi:QueT transporter family protein [Loigolactobacillus zhaoyuanensis]|uniref:QueT transporter family protein n=1 Tax=Loigolactobacillus zhaoyuanensis TaxID=2486017 RepID=A0ABW8U8I8_9LACO|nr:QueT transporter family protein [Loigolactobacillus zhaoyuanensis]
MEKTRIKTSSLTKIGVIAALYIVITMLVAPWSFGAVQLRFSEMLNHLAIFNKRYIWALTIGCAIVNLFSPLGIIDIIFGTLGTLAMTTISYYVSRHLKHLAAKLAASTIICTIAMWSVALELHIVSKLPFWPTYFSVALGELFSLVIGALLFYVLAKRIDLTE